MSDFSSIVVSSRVRLFRNLMGFKFPSVLDETEGNKVLNKIAENVLNIFKNYSLYRIKNLSELDVNVMREKKIITGKLIDAMAYSSVILSPDESISIMINENDHITEQCYFYGLNLFNAYEVLSQIDDQIISQLDIAFDDDIGFLTSNISNIGTGLKASVTMFLPGLAINNSIDEVIEKVQKHGFEVNKFDEDEQNQAYYYTFSNSITIGKRESIIISELTELVIQISNREIEERKKMLSLNNINKIKDKVYRAWGILTNCFEIDLAEAIKYLGEIKMGIALDIIKFKNVSIIEKLMTSIMPYCLTKFYKSKISSIEIDKYRAEFISQMLKMNRI